MAMLGIKGARGGGLLINNNNNFSYNNIVSTFHTSSILNKRTGKRQRVIPEWKKAKFAAGPWWKKPKIVMRSPIAQTHHPVNQFESAEEDFLSKVEARSCCDHPVNIEDPYSKDPKMCVLCPRQYQESIVPDYKNPKLLSQFVSPHTGNVYQSHITGLCKYMQKVVEKEVGRSRAAGFMSTKVIDPLYLQDPPLFNPSKPTKPNPW